MNVKLLRKVAKHILAEPKRLFMSSYICSEAHRNIGREYAKCGTAACIAGWTCILKFKIEDPHEFWMHNHVGNMAAEALGITEDQQIRLFEPAEWPKKFSLGTTDDGSKASAKAAVARIEHFIKTKGKE